MSLLRVIDDADVSTDALTHRECPSGPYWSPQWSLPAPDVSVEHQSGVVLALQSINVDVAFLANS